MFEESKHSRDRNGKFSRNGNKSIDDKDKVIKAIKKYSDSPNEDILTMGLTKTQNGSKMNIQLLAADYSKLSDKGLQNSIKSHNKKISEHEDKIAHPEKFYDDWNDVDSNKQKGRLFSWEKEIANYKNQIQMAKKEITERSKKQ